MSNPSQSYGGLTTAEVEERIQRGQRNRHVVRPTRTYWQIVRANVLSLYNVILIASFTALLILRGPGSAIFPAAIVFINMLLGLVQEIRAKLSLDRLATLSARRVMVRRNGVAQRIRLEEIVQDDVIDLGPGDSAVVDGPVLLSNALEMDESQLTGESEYIPKQPGDLVTSGSFCVSGSGLMRAAAVGSSSYVNNLAEVARAYRAVRSPLESELDAIVRVLIAVMVFLAPLTLISGERLHLSLGDTVENLVNLISSLVPQGLLVFVAISFAFGVLNISRFRALIQRPNAVELMGNITCLCADKTGTLTENRLILQEITPAAGIDRAAVRQKLAQYVSAVSWQNRTVVAIAAEVGATPQVLENVHEVPFRSDRRWSSVSLAGGETLLLGAPELFRLDAQLQAEAARLSAAGLRVLAFAVAGEQPDTNSLEPPAAVCMALIALVDEVRPDIPAALKEFAQQGIAIKIISGDAAETVRAVARRAGLPSEAVLTGADLEQMDAAALADAALGVSLFARVAPRLKSRIVGVLAARGPVAMIGDGVNDVPALKQASLAIAMNGGAQIARDVSDIILLDNAFSTLPKAFYEGRQITARLRAIARINLVKVAYLTILFVLAGYAGLPWPMNLLQTSWLSLVTLTLPAMLIIFRALPLPADDTQPLDLVQYIVPWGAVGAAGLLLLEGLAVIVLRASLPAVRAAMLAFAGLYNSLVLLDVYGVSRASLRSARKPLGPLLAALCFGIGCALLPAYALGRFLGTAPMSIPLLLLLAVLLGLARSIVGALIRRWVQSHAAPLAAKASG